MQALAPRVMERRASPRVRGKQHVFIYDPVDALEEVYGGWILDRSRGGVCLSVKRADIETGNLLVLRPTSAESPGIAVRVKNCRPQDGIVLLGCQFVRS
ncbi:MAG: PilZ domain-containing protein [Gemmataceae bacterium]|nr:PilZ domain-containing protein [Gemmataceae bacterium]